MEMSTQLIHILFFLLLLTLTLTFRHVLISLLCLTTSIATSTILFLSARPRPIFLLNYSCFLPDPDRQCPLEVSEYIIRRSGNFSHTSEQFMRNIFLKSGLGPETYAPPFFFLPSLSPSFSSASLESQESVLSASSSLLSKTGLSPSLVDLLIVSSGSNSPTPSLSSFLVNRLNLLPCTQTFNLSSMGCVSGALAVDLGARIMSSSGRVRHALVVVTENTTLNWYTGDDRSMLVSNCIFRVGAVAALLTNDPNSRRRGAKLQLLRSLRTHSAADDSSYAAAYQTEDEKGVVGISLQKDLIRVAAAGLASHVWSLVPRVLPWVELFRCIYKGRKYMPDMTAAFQHVCIHTGGKAVIDAVARVMRFEEHVIEPARMCLHRFGNTSSSLVFYELGYFEAKGRVKRGDRIWMLAFGSGFKACSLVWRSLKDSEMDDDNPWRNCIHRYPM